MKLSEIQNKKIIDINSGKNIGFVIDADFDMEGKINYLVVEGKNSIFFSSKESSNINWIDIKKVGEDVILVSRKE